MSHYPENILPLPSQEILRSLLDYDPTTGRLIWKERPTSMFPSVRAARVWNTRYAGREAFTSLDSKGYHQAGIFNKVYRAHRVIYALLHGEFDGYIDHINGVRTDNREGNLRLVTKQANQRNMKLHPANSSGCSGVNWKKNRGKWQAYIRGANHKTIHLGLFDTKEEAIAARKAAEVMHSYHPNHGKSRN